VAQQGGFACSNSSLKNSWFKMKMIKPQRLQDMNLAKSCVNSLKRSFTCAEEAA
jgi:hypothetical protein